MANHKLTRRQQDIYRYLQENLPKLSHPPTLDELCSALGLKSRGSLHKQIQALISEGLVEPMNNLRRGVRLCEISSPEKRESIEGLPFYGSIAAGLPIEAIAGNESMLVPTELKTSKPCYVLEVKGDSMIEEGILDGDWVVIEQRDIARNGEIVVALIDDGEATLKRLEQDNSKVTLHPANREMKPMHYHASQVTIQGVLVGQMRSYH